MLDDNRTAGFFAHTMLGVSDEGVPLGIFDQQVWRRAKSTGKVPDAHKKRPITQKESMKWLNGLYAILPSPTHVITVADREVDIYELFQEVDASATDCIIRATHNRCLASDNKLVEALQKVDFEQKYAIEVARQAQQDGRLAQVGIRYTTVTLLPPQNRPQSSEVIPLYPVTLQVVEVLEFDVPAGSEAIHWLLITTLPVDVLADAQRIVRFYTYRWRVERFHFVLKSGCRFETSQLQSYEALTRFLALCSHQAWQILALTYQARVTPDAPCDTLLSPDQWLALLAHQTRQPATPAVCPTYAQACLWIAQLGGFIGRASDGHPGVKVLWRGWRRLHDLVAMWTLFHQPP